MLRLVALLLLFSAHACADEWPGPVSEPWPDTSVTTPSIQWDEIWRETFVGGGNCASFGFTTCTPDACDVEVCSGSCEPECRGGKLGLFNDDDAFALVQALGEGGSQFDCTDFAYAGCRLKSHWQVPINVGMGAVETPVIRLYDGATPIASAYVTGDGSPPAFALLLECGTSARVEIANGLTTATDYNVCLEYEYGTQSCTARVALAADITDPCGTSVGFAQASLSGPVPTRIDGVEYLARGGGTIFNTQVSDIQVEGQIP